MRLHIGRLHIGYLYLSEIDNSGTLIIGRLSYRWGGHRCTPKSFYWYK